MDWVEVLGIAATVFVLISFLFDNEIKIRLVNIVGALLFVGYGMRIGSLSVWTLNAVLVVVHAYKLHNKLIKKKEVSGKIVSVYTHDNKLIKKISKED